MKQTNSVSRTGSSKDINNFSARITILESTKFDQIALISKIIFQMKNKTVLLFTLMLMFNHVFAQTNTWTGSTDNDWHKACNWSLDLIPTATHAVVIPVVSEYPTINNNAHCKTLSITTTAANAVNLNSSGGGNLCISSTNNGTCSTVLTDNGGCTVPGSAFEPDGDYYLFGIFDCVGFTPYSFAQGNRIITNNTSFNITMVIPNFGCADQSPQPGNFLLTAGSSVNLYVQAGSGTSAPNCCVQNFTQTVTWSSTDGGSGSFIVETANNL